MKRPFHIWLVVGLCATVLLTALAWVTWTALALDRAQRLAQQQAEFEERVRLALWRMDSAITPLLVEENSRPATAYEPFPAAGRAYTKGFGNIQQGDVIVPSPLLSLPSTNVLLHFQFGPNGRLESPQVPAARQLALAQANAVSSASVSASSTRLGALQELLNAECFAGPPPAGSTLSFSSSTVATKKTFLSNRDVLIQQCAVLTTNQMLEQVKEDVAQANPPAQLVQQPQLRDQRERNAAEWNARANVNQQVQQQAFVGNGKLSYDNVANLPLNDDAPVTPLKPVWVGSELLLARRVTVGNSFLIQGCWLNWTNLKASLVAGVRDLFPGADLKPSHGDPGGPSARTLAALPLKLLVPEANLKPMGGASWSPIRLALAVAWSCAVAGGLALALLLHGTLSLSERRAAFVSAVTHELRTPLTTFRMYSEMLADDMVPDATKRRHYLNTLCSEASRLSHLVENVLAYARLERGSARSRVERITLGTLIGRVKERLDQRAAQAGMTIVVDSDAAGLAAPVTVDVAAVEQILFNLVDNACKYAAPGATEKLIHLEALPDGKFAMLRVRDHGRGISAEGARRLFQPFSKSAHEAAHSAPGVGLGLALCRRLSRSMGGDLRLDALVKDGACFVLRMPVSAAGKDAALG